VINCQSIKSKKEVFNDFIDTYYPDIIFGTESWLSSTFYSNEIFPHNYNIYRKDREDGFGGVFLACNDQFVSREIPIRSECEIVAASVKLAGSSDLIICSVYRPPNSSLEYLQALCKDLEHLIEEYSDSPVWIGGDMNLPNIDWQNNVAKSGSYPISFCNTFLDLLNNYGFMQGVKSGTRGDNILDIFCTNRPSLLSSCYPIPGISDHDAVYIKSSTTAQLSPPFNRTIYLWSRVDMPQLHQRADNLCSTFLSNYTSTTPITVLWEQFKIICHECLKVVPTKQVTANTQAPWINRRIKSLSRRKHRLYKRARQSGLTSDWADYHQAKKESQQQCRRTYNNYICNLACSKQGQVSKKLWSFIKAQRNDHCGVAALQDNGVVYSDPKSKAELINRAFSTVFTTEDTSNMPAMSDMSHPEMPPIQIDINGIVQLLQNLKPSKAPGPDKIPTRLLKELAFEFAPSLAVVFKASLGQGQLPQEWKHANVVPIYKKGDRSSPLNYRPVSLTCVCCKILEHIICSNIFQHLDDRNILCDNQNGFRKGRSCESQLITTVDDFLQNLNLGLQTDVLLLDFKKAFDKVPHQRLCYKLSHYGIRGATLEWIKNFLVNRTQKVVVNGYDSSSREVISGVPQGTVLGPLLFLCYINDLPRHVKSSVKLYADDVILYRVIDSDVDHEILQQDLVALSEWANIWQMTFNLAKCELLCITNKKNPSKYCYSLNGENVRGVPHTKYLGVILDEHLTFNEHIKKISFKAHQVKSFLQRNISSCPSKVKEACYKSMVRPVIEYASTVWSPYTKVNTNLIEAVQRRAARFVTGDFGLTSSVTEMIQSLGWISLEQRRKILRLIMLFKILHNVVTVPNHYIPTISYSYTRGHTQRFQQLQAHLDVYLHSFFPSALKMWNSLPATVIEATNVEEFKKRVLNHYCINQATL